MAKQEGPRRTVNLSCADCCYCHSERYRVQGDSGCDVTCAHPSRKGSENYIGDTTWATPSWCPLRGEQ